MELCVKIAPSVLVKPLCHLLMEFSLPCSLNNLPLLNLFLLPATFVFNGKLPLLKDFIPTLTDFTHFGTEINILCMKVVPLRHLASLEGIIVNCNYYTTWIIIIAFYLALPHKAERHGSAYLFCTRKIVMKWNIHYTLFQMRHFRSWGVHFIHHIHFLFRGW